MNYPTEIIIPQYSTDKEYRKYMRILFGMTSSSSTNPVVNDNNNTKNKNNQIDEITEDENNYDERTMNAFINMVLYKTQHTTELQELYKLAAATMCSLDVDIGLVILFSFDYMFHFHHCLCDFFKNPHNDLYSNVHYTYLQNRLTHH
jgi:hypothetical protein